MRTLCSALFWTIATSLLFAQAPATTKQAAGEKPDVKQQDEQKAAAKADTTKKGVAKKVDEKQPSPDDQYKLGPDSMEHDGVPQGTVQEFELTDSKTYLGFTRKWWIYVPAQYDGKTPAALMVFQDGGGYVNRKGSWRVPTVFDNLIHKKEMPVTVAVFINPGDKPLKEGEAPRKSPTAVGRRRPIARSSTTR
ncbi:MAG: hypothetical protein QM811_29375 [Pirellulales bacterium]